MKVINGQFFPADLILLSSRQVSYFYESMNMNKFPVVLRNFYSLKKYLNHWLW